jgi:hypothetical protein
MDAVRKSLVVLAAVNLAACAPEPRHTSQRVRVHVVSDPGVPLAAATLHAGARNLGESGDDGAIEVELPGRPGDVVALDLHCPEGYRASEGALSVLLREPQPHEAPPEYALACPPRTRTLIVAVRAERGENLPLRYLGDELTRTDGTGTAHALVQATPGDALTLTLDTSAEPQLMPQHPELKVSVPDYDDVVVFDQTFVRPKPPKRKAPPPPKPAEPTGPERF